MLSRNILGDKINELNPQSKNLRAFRNILGDKVDELNPQTKNHYAL